MNRIKELREKFGFKQIYLASLLNCTAATISKYELNQRDIDSATIGRLCDIFDCTADYLLGRSDMPDQALRDGEPEMLLAYRKAPPEIQQSIRLILLQYSEKNTSSRTA